MTEQAGAPLNLSNQSTNIAWSYNIIPILLILSVGSHSVLSRATAQAFFVLESFLIVV